MLEKNEYTIALWGPRSSGKTWFIHAFARKLLKDYVNDTDFTFDIRDAVSNVPIPAIPPSDIQGTMAIGDTTWLFSRNPKKTTESHKISAYEHLITVTDDSGDATFYIQNTNNDMTKQNIVNSDYLLIMLDPTRDPTHASKPISSSEGNSHRKIPGELDGQPEEPSSEISAEQYAEQLTLLFETLLIEGKDKHYCIAVCITKVDQLGVRRRDPWEIIQLYFGRNMYDFLQRYSQMKDRFTIETFSISSFGFVGSVRPEANNAGGKLKSSDHWDPYNVEAPLFWLFEMIERKKLHHPQSGVLGLSLFSKSRSDTYIPYKIKRR